MEALGKSIDEIAAVIRVGKRQLLVNMYVVSRIRWIPSWSIHIWSFLRVLPFWQSLPLGCSFRGEHMAIYPTLSG